MNEIFCKHLLEYRKRAGYSQKDMSGKLLIEESLYSQYENGTAEPGFDALIRIADVLKCSLDELFGRGRFYRGDASDYSMVREAPVQYENSRVKKKVLIGLQDFRRLRELNAYYVDKTMMIGEFLDSPYQITLITRPRRFGKTMNMSMLAEFLDCTRDSKAIFAGTKISRTEWMAELNQCPVIFLSLLEIKSDTAEGMLWQLSGRIREEYKRYYNMLNSGKLSGDQVEEFNHIYNVLAHVQSKEQWKNCVIRSILVLCEVLSSYYGKNVYLLIDEYDTPFMSANTNGYYSEVRSVLAGFLSTSLKGNPYLERAILTGIQRVAKENIFSGLNNLTVLTVNDSEYEDCFGFTEEEVRKLLNDFDLEFTDEVKEMYDGYRFGNKDIYNPWSVTNYAVRKRLAPYWVNTAENSILKDALRERGTTFEKEYNKLIETGEITTVVSLTTAYYEHQSDASLWGLMVNAGMLTIQENMGDDYYTLRIPNQEVWSAFRELAAFSLQIDEGDMQKLFMELVRGNIDEFAERYQNILLTLPSYHDLQCENSYHMMVLGMCVFQQKNYIIESNRENGNGRADLLMRAKRSGYPNMILEFKYTKDKKEDLDKLAMCAAEQIKDKKYDMDMKNPIYYIGLAHCGKQAAVYYQNPDRTPASLYI